MPYIGKKPADIIATAIDTTTGDFSGVVTANAGIKVDNITIDATEVDLSSGTFTIDSASDITLDADGGGVLLKDGGTEFGRIFNSSSDLILKSAISDKDMKFQGNDDGATVNALILDMSDAGTAIFNHDAKITSGNIQFGASGSETGQIEINGGRLLQRSTGDASGLRFDGSAYTPFKNGSAADGTVDIGSTGARYKDLFLSSGVFLGGTGAANELTDYEEGEYTVTATPSAGGSITLNSSVNTGSYTKIGRFVNVGALVNVSSVSSPSGFIGINLPFTPANLGERAGDSVGSIYISGGASAPIRDYVATVNEGDVRLFIQLGDGTSGANDSAQQIQANVSIVFNINYHTA